MPRTADLRSPNARSTAVLTLLATVVSFSLGAPVAGQPEAIGARDACRSGDPKAAVVACTELLDLAIKDDGVRSGLHVNRANAYDDLGQPEAALADYDRALELDPRNAYAHRNRGVTLTRLRRLSDALDAFAKAIEIKPDYAEAYGSRAENLRETARGISPQQGTPLYARALADYDKTISLLGGGERSGIAYQGRGFVHYYLSHLDAAIADFTKAIELGSVGAYMPRAVAYTDVQDFDRATADIDKVSTLRNDSAIGVLLQEMRSRIFLLRGLGLFQTGQYVSALANWDEALKLNPAQTELRYCHGVAQRLIGNIVEGDAEIAAARNQQPNVAEQVATVCPSP